MIIARGFWPGPARSAAYVHNRTKHKGVPTAYIDVDEKDKTSWLPKYKVWCPKCKGSIEQLVLF